MYATNPGINGDAYNMPFGGTEIGRQTLTAAQAVAAKADGLLKQTALPDAAADVTTFLAAMPYARTVTAVCSGTQTGDMTITGTNIDGFPITETIALTSANAVESTKAFKTVTKISLPIKEDSETINVGYGSGIGIPFKLSASVTERPYIEATLNGVTQTTAPTVTGDAAELAKNYLKLASSLNGTEVCIYYYL